jgi:cysteine sulfinate desulfinase/cysteine desulfurase-like protein
MEAQISGGGQERGLRSGTLPTQLCVGFGEACRVAVEEMEYDHARIKVPHPRGARRRRGFLSRGSRRSVDRARVKELELQPFVAAAAAMYIFSISRI